jgi:hypothetical protein
MKTSGYLAAASLALLLAGCAGFGMSQARCAGENWELLGESDGNFGARPQIYQYAEQCRRHGLAVAPASRELYLKGWRIGYAEANQRGGHGNE